MTSQILWGSILLGFCSATNLIFIVWWIEFLKKRIEMFRS